MIQVLVIEDWNGSSNVDAVTERIGEALVSITEFERLAGRREDGLVKGYRIEFNTGLLRNTSAHGFGCAAGFISVIENV
ncbi:hypothetical protein UFOVP1305_90 [uncultured Caudovirales phage]|uniref:Uncharacterized protein n=1 Tax=uncultured Caudovirales phage TaxID=2100421 RepID=A0A6J5PEG1_9CAUD|nr:hypothetical protein UFOVP896_35 [uncultured Caudovirales phage]CAB4198431.1 hypothetical protein UFOVP1305_90 [uncultured Caudovirales phage]